jgi:pimeloyl-ACP methyl ester carboxylesterase
MLIDIVHRFVRSTFRRLGMESKFIETTSCYLHYFEYPHPNPKGTIVLVHGLGTSSSTWLKVLPILIRNHRVIALDLPRFGFSDLKSGKSFSSLSEHRAALTTLVDYAAQDAFTLVGQSFGGWICVQYAAEHPRRVAHLILINTAGIYYRGVEFLREIFTIETVADTRRLLNALWYRYPWYFKPFTRAIFRELSHRNMNNIVNSIEAKDFLAEELSQLRTPVSVIWGKQDKAISLAAVDVIKRLAPRSNVYLIDRCGHVPQLERPEEVKRILSSILLKGAHELG